MASDEKQNKLRLKINFDGFKLDVSSDNPDRTLSELNKLIRSKKELLEVLGSPEIYELGDAFEDGDIGFEFRTGFLTKELKSNVKSMENIRNLSLKHGRFLYRKEKLDIKCEIDLNNKTLKVVIEKKDINNLIKKLLFDIESKTVAHVFVHIIGENLSRHHKVLILDELKKRTGFTDTTFLFTKKKIAGALVAETLLFGEFPQNNEEGY